MQTSTFSSVLQLQIVLVLIMAVGFFATKKKFIDAKGRACLTDLLIYFILPCNIVCSFLGDLSPQILADSFGVLILAFLAQLITWVAGKFIYPFAAPGRKKVLQYATMCSNAGFMGCPIIGNIYGAQGLLYAAIYLVPLRFFMWSAGLSCFTDVKWKETVKKLLMHPCVNAVWVGLIFMLTPLSVPAAALQTLESFSDCTLMVSILIVGSILAEIKLKSLISKTMAYFCTIRLIIIPLVSLGLSMLLGFDPLVTAVAVLLSGMPAGATTAILAEKYNGDAVYASQAVFVSTILSLFTIPVLYQFMNMVL